MPQVTVWSNPSCVMCNAVKRKFDKHDIAYEEGDLSLPEHMDRLEAFRALGHMHAPVVTLDDEVIFSGFNPGKIKEHFGV